MQSIPPQFCPTIILFADRCGDGDQSVYRHFGDLCAGLDSVLWPTTGLIHVTAREQEQSSAPAESSGASPDLTSHNHVDSAEAVTPPLHGTALPIQWIDEFLPYSAASEVAPRTPRGIEPGQTAPLTTLFEMMVKSVRNVRVLQSIVETGLPLTAHLQVFIVAYTQTEILAESARIVRDVLRRARISATVAALMLDVPRFRYDPAIPGEKQPDWINSLICQLDKDGQVQMPTLDFAFLHHELARDAVFYEENDVAYAAAETLFGLVATGIHASTIYSDTLRVHPRIKRLEQRLGGFGTSLIFFPRQAASEYCANRLSADIIGDWVERLQIKEATKEEKDRCVERAQRAIDYIQSILEDSEERPGTREIFGSQSLNWAHLRVLQEPIVPEDQRTDRRSPALRKLLQNSDSNRNLSAQLRDASQRTFDRFEHWNIANKLADTITWAEAANLAYQDALNSFHLIIALTERIYSDLEARLKYQFESQIDKIWLRDRSSFNEATEYVIELYARLANLSLTLRAWRRQHWDNFEGYMKAFEHKVASPRWNGPPQPLVSASVLQGTPSATGPEYRPPSPLENTEPSFTGVDSDGTDQSVPEDIAAHEPQFGELDEREQNLVARLGRRADWIGNIIPSPLQGVAATLLGAPALTLIAGALLAPSQSLAPGFDFLVFMLFALLIGLGFVVLRWHMRRQHLLAQDDLLDVYTLCLAHRCTIREDQMRVAAVMQPLLRDVDSMRTHLLDMKSFLEVNQENCQAAADRAAERLFNGPARVRDVFIANGNELTPNGYTLEDFYTDFTHRREAITDEDHLWQRSYSDINERLRRFLAEQELGIIAMESTEVGNLIAQFTNVIVDHLLQGDLVDIGTALLGDSRAGSPLWKKAIERAAVLYVPPYTPQRFLHYCGFPEYCSMIDSHVIPAGATRVLTRQREWFLLATLQQGDSVDSAGESDFEIVIGNGGMPPSNFSPTWRLGQGDVHV